ncbi:MAG: InlB B-repeat-containing protein [Bacilli bacterium]|nr:InlB B-repeat-containing protein [Bacilli bacterium]
MKKNILKKTALLTLLGTIALGTGLMVSNFGTKTIQTNAEEEVDLAPENNYGAWYLKFESKYLYTCLGKPTGDMYYNSLKVSHNETTMKSFSESDQHVSIQHGPTSGFDGRTTLTYNSIVSPEKVEVDVNGSKMDYNFTLGVTYYYWGNVDIFYQNNSSLNVHATGQLSPSWTNKTKDKTSIKDQWNIDGKSVETKFDRVFYTIDNQYVAQEGKVGGISVIPTAFEIPKKGTLTGDYALPVLFGGNQFIDVDGILKTFQMPTYPVESLAGSSFAGYFDKTNYEMYYDQNGVASKTENLTEDTSLISLFKYDVDFNLNGGDISTEGQTVTNEMQYLINNSAYLATVETELPKAAKEGYAFGGWYDNPLFLGDKIESISELETGDVTLYAKWDNIVSFDTDGGSVVEPQIVSTLDYASKPEDPTKEVDGIRYQFFGWYADPEYKNEFDFDNTPILDSITIYAKFTSYVDVFVLGYMHLEIPTSNPGEGKCISQGWYSAAKDEFLKLNEFEQDLFLNGDDYSAMALRFRAWARANGEDIDFLTHEFNTYYMSDQILASLANTYSTNIIIICAACITVGLIVAFIIIKKKKTNK